MSNIERRIEIIDGSIPIRPTGKHGDVTQEDILRAIQEFNSFTDEEMEKLKEGKIVIRQKPSTNPSK